MTICLSVEVFIDKKNKQIGIFDLGNHILIIGMVLILVFILINVE